MNIRAEFVSSQTGERQAVLLSGHEARLAVGQVSTVSLGVEVGQVVGYEREGDDLIVFLTNGETITLSDYFLDDADGKPVLQLLDNTTADYVNVGVDPSGSAGLMQPMVTQEGLFGSNTQAWAWGAAGSVAIAGGLALAGAFDDGFKSGRMEPESFSFGLANDSDSGAKGDGITNNKTPTINGTAEANATVTIYIKSMQDGSTDTRVLGTAIANKKGQWSYQFKAGDMPADGTYQITATQSDVAGNVSTISDAHEVTLDTKAEPPVITGLDDNSDSGVKGDGITNNKTPTITGTADANAPILLFVNNNSVGATEANQSGNWTYQIEAADMPADGTYQITATQKDVAGNVSATSDAYKVTLDTIAPDNGAKPVINGLNENSDSGVKGDGITNNKTPTITGTAEANATVTIHINDNLAGETKATGDGQWSYQFKDGAMPADGAYQITATQSDVAGNMSATSDTYEVTLDMTAPGKPEISGLVDTAAPTLTITGNGSSGEVTFTFSEKVKGFDEADIKVANGQLDEGSLTQMDHYPWIWTAGVTADFPQTKTNIAVDVAAGAFSDLSGNLNKQSAANKTTLQGAFDQKKGNIPDLSNLDTSHVVSMRSTFIRRENFNQDISGWDVSNVKTMRFMFYDTASFNQDISSWDVAKLEDIQSMFSKAKAFDQDIGGWNVANLKNASGAFSDSGLTTQNYDKILSGWSDINHSQHEAGLRHDVKLGANRIEYTDATSRQHLIDDYGWKITDGNFANNVTVGDEKTNTLNKSKNSSAQIIHGLGGDDIITGGSGDDILVGGDGNDTLKGGGGRDTFVYKFTSAGSDTIKDFTIGNRNGDIINLHQLLDGAEMLNIDNFISVTDDGSNIKLSIDADGGGPGSDVVTIELVGIQLKDFSGVSIDDVKANLWIMIDNGSLVI